MAHLNIMDLESRTSKMAEKEKEKKYKLLTEDSEEVSKDDYKALHRVFPELGRESKDKVNEVDRNNALALIIKNRTKWKDDPFSEAEIREMATNPRGRLGKHEEVSDKPAKKSKGSVLYDNPRSGKK